MRGGGGHSGAVSEGKTLSQPWGQDRDERLVRLVEQRVVLESLTHPGTIWTGHHVAVGRGVDQPRELGGGAHASVAVRGRVGDEVAAVMYDRVGIEAPVAQEDLLRKADDQCSTAEP